MNGFFMSLNDDCGDQPENMLHSQDPWLDSSSPSVTKESNSRIVEEHKRQNSFHNIFESDDEEFEKDFFGDFSRPKSVGTIPKSKRKLSTNISDPCLLSCLPSDLPLPATATERSTNNSELNSLDSGIPEEFTTANVHGIRTTPSMEKEQDRNREQEAHFQRVFVERRSDFPDCKSDKRGRGNSLGHHKNRNLNLDIEHIHTNLDKTTEELSSLKISHGKLQKVLSEKASELSHAVRKAEVYEREAKKLRHKLEEIRRQQRHERQERSSVSSEKEVRTTNGEKSEKHRRHTSDSQITKNVVKQTPVTLQGSQQEASNFKKASDDDIYDEIDNTSEKIEASNVNNIYDTPVLAQIKKENFKTEPEKLEQSTDKTFNNKEGEVVLNKSKLEEEKIELIIKSADDNQSEEHDTNNANTDDSNQAIYATVNLEMKKNCKRQKDCNNGNIILTEKENIVAII